MVLQLDRCSGNLRGHMVYCSDDAVVAVVVGAALADDDGGGGGIGGDGGKAIGTEDHLIYCFGGWAKWQPVGGRDSLGGDGAGRKWATVIQLRLRSCL